MRACVLLLLLVCAAAAFPQRRTQLQISNEPDKQFIEEVVVESVLRVRSADAGRQARTNTKTNLQDGARVSALRAQPN